MSSSKHYNLIAIIAMAVAVVIAVALYGYASAGGSGLKSTSSAKKYETTLFDTSTVHTINLEVSDWDSFIKNCENEEYVVCSATIDGTTLDAVGLRAKGNTSLSTVSSLGSQRYSFKLEFDHYNKGGNYDGLDKLSLNNTIQDTTYMKDYLSYQLMNQMGVDAPLCSYVYITVNGKDWGLYLAVEGIEESFLERTKNGEGELYKPESMNMGGGRGNGKDFNMDDFNAKRENSANQDESQSGNGNGNADGQSADNSESTPAQGSQQMPQGFSFNGQTPPSGDNAGGQMPPGGDSSTSQMPPSGDNAGGQTFPGGDNSNFSFNTFGGKGGFGGMGGSGTNLKYTDDNLSSYSSIFDNSVTDTTVADQNRVVQALKTLSTQTNVESAVNVDQVIRYFAAHNFVVNSDSYTGTMIHNYYLYENNGVLSMIPWDYNLAFGTFTASNASAAVNDAIDSPLEASGDGSLPMFDFIVNNDEYLTLYHQYMQQLVTTVDFDTMVSQTAEMIAPYVAKDPTAFYSYEDFESGVDALKTFCNLRCQSIQAQLQGTIATTDSARSDSDQLIETGSLNLSDMGSMGGGMGGGGNMGNGGGMGGNAFGGPGNMGNGTNNIPGNTDSNTNSPGNGNESVTPPNNTNGQEGTTNENNTNSGNAFNGMTPPSDGNFSGGQAPSGGEAPQGGFSGGTPPSGTGPSGGMQPNNGGMSGGTPA